MRTQKKIENEAHVSMKPTQADRTYSNKNAGCSLFELSRPAAYRHIAYFFPVQTCNHGNIKKSRPRTKGFEGWMWNVLAIDRLDASEDDFGSIWLKKYRFRSNSSNQACQTSLVNCSASPLVILKQCHPNMWEQHPKKQMVLQRQRGSIGQVWHQFPYRINLRNNR